MAKLKEIETKWNAEKVDRETYNRSLSSFLKSEKLKYKFLSVKGFDYYMAAKTGHVVRHRVSKNTNELTVKARMDKSSTTIRAEGNISLSSSNDIREVHGTLSLLGFDNVTAIYKDCDIYFLDDNGTEVSIVWYTVKYQGRRDRIFMEVEIHGMSQQKSVKQLNKWSRIMSKLFGISKVDVVKDSLYEIYSGKKYRMVKKKRPSNVIPLHLEKMA
jgi:adenylate cyclase class IV